MDTPQTTVLFCGPVKNCAKYLRQVFCNIQKLGNSLQQRQLCSSWDIYCVVDKSSDATEELLDALHIPYTLINTPISQYRTHRLAHARNLCIEYVKTHNFKYCVMMDFDDVNATHHVNTSIFVDGFIKTQTNPSIGITFNTYPAYYDIWALSISPYTFSYAHFKNSGKHNYDSIQEYIMKILQRSSKNSLISCISAFNGLAIYSAEAINELKYDGRPRFDMMPMSWLKLHCLAANTKTLLFHDYGHVKGKYEDCEHRAFHLQGLLCGKLHMYIYNGIVFSCK